MSAGVTWDVRLASTACAFSDRPSIAAKLVKLLGRRSGRLPRSDRVGDAADSRSRVARPRSTSDLGRSRTVAGGNTRYQLLGRPGRAVEPAPVDTLITARSFQLASRSPSSWVIAGPEPAGPAETRSRLVQLLPSKWLE